MNEVEGYAVFFFPQALEALGDAIKPYLEQGPAGPHVMCREIDTGGALIEMTLAASGDARAMGRELMVPTSMVRMIVSARSDEAFGFGPRPPLVTAAQPPAAVPPLAAAPAHAPEAAAPVPAATEPAAPAPMPASNAAPEPGSDPTAAPSHARPAATAQAPSR